MLRHVSRLAIRAPRRVLLAAAVCTMAAAGYGATVAEHLSAAGFQDPGSQSVRGAELLAEKFGQGDADLTFVVRSPDGVFAPQAAAQARELVSTVRHAPHVASVLDPWGLAPAEANAMVSADGKAALILARVSGGESEAQKHAKEVSDKVAGEHGALTVRAGGMSMVLSEINEQSERDLVSAEAVAVPLTFLVLMWVFGGLYAALLPLVVGLLSIAATLGALRLFTVFADVSVFALNLTTAMGFALAIDYTLLLVSRYREEHERTKDRAAALRRAVDTAGRTVAFSACTVFLAVGALGVFPMYFLRSMAYAGCAVVALAALYAVVVAPAMIMLLGDRIDGLDVRRLLRRKSRNPAPAAESGPQGGVLYRTTRFVMRHAATCALAATAALLLLGSAFTRAQFGLPDDRVLPATAQSRQVGDALRAEFPQNAAVPVSIVIPDASGIAAQEVSGYADELSKVPGVAVVDAPDGSHVRGGLAGPSGAAAGTKDASVWLTAVLRAPAFTEQSRAALADVRAVPRPKGVEVLFTGTEQLNEDTVAAIMRQLPFVFGFVAVTTFLLLFLLTGSILLPLKALVLNTLSLSATLGALVWIFQEGHVGGFGTTTTGTLVSDMLVFLFTVAFGLSMDYEVFLLSRIREFWLASARRAEDNAEAVALGVSRAGRVVTAAALLMFVVFVSLITSEVSFMRMFGLGLAVAVAVDATLVRMVLLPAFMRLAGTWNWWLPEPLARLHRRVGLREG
ncbi:MMPL domain protein [Segniliparus rotundus DSM 44985]|uniref:MMPL domain protein n=1 Tax=Segniliparus rotundus (strain ATCC BAA-972 / CDC 1076 / CIP 108378 / DSM 44985 / JCM 13578) TaxID=640132 RepID=D6ZAW7_SEGRD|nr:MMPL family transporter [Segniliparus rotundus]ADG98853.1 MMPL domain protein [Segniliparus rotundus DSM 44985]